jgi:glucuronate isomerase
MAKKSYTAVEIDRAITDLIESFEVACELHKTTLASRESNRARKELTKENMRGTNLHKFQSNFAWVIHDMTHGAICMVEDNISEATSIISHINNISNN